MGLECELFQVRRGKVMVNFVIIDSIYIRRRRRRGRGL